MAMSQAAPWNNTLMHFSMRDNMPYSLREKKARLCG